MKQRTFRIRRQVGAALLAGVTALGVASIAGEGVASASTVSSVTLTGTTYSTSTAANWTATFVPASALAATGTITVSFGGTAAGSTFAVPASPTVVLNSNFSNCSASAVGTAAGTSAASVKVTLSGTNCTVAAGAPTSLTIDGLTNPSSAATFSATTTPIGNVVTSADTTPAPASNTVTFTLPAPTISVSPSTVATSSLNGTVNPLTITIPTADLSTFTTSTATAVVPVALQISGPNGVGENFNVSSGLPTITQTNGAAISSTNGPGVTANSPVAAVYPQLATAAGGLSGSGLQNAGLTATALTTTTVSTSNPTGVVQGNTLVFGVSGSETTSPLTFYVSGLHADGTNAGVVTVTVSAGAATSVGANNVIPVNSVTAKAIGSGTLYTVGSLPSAIYGQTPDATAAAEFDSQFVSVSSAGHATCTNNNAAVVATDHDFLDALSASFLEKSLGTGVLITPQTSAGPDLLAALKYAGVQRVYIVGGPLAINQSVINTISSTPAYTCGGLAATGSNIQVFGPIYGQTADETAAAIDNYAPVPASATMSFAGAYSAATSTTGGGLYNQTSGSATASAPAGSQPTAIVVANTDFQDDMAASGLAYKYGLPIVLTSGSSLGATASSELTKLGIKQVIALGGNLALNNAVVTSIQGMGISVMRIAGYDYTQTAADIAQFEAQQLGWTSSTVLVAQGAYWSDAIAAAPLSGINDQPILLTEGPTKGVGTYTDAVLKLAGTPSNGLGGTNPPMAGAQTTTTIQVLGGPLAITASQIAEMQAALASGATS